MSTANLTYWKVFRLIFVVFSLYLLGDGFYRWDGFRYYGSFYEFLPSVGFVSILCTIIVSVIAFLFWLTLRIITSFQTRSDLTNIQKLLLFIFLFSFLAFISFITKHAIWLNAPVTPFLKLAIYSGVILLAIMLTLKIARLQGRKRLKIIQFFYTVVVLSLVLWIAIKKVYPHTQVILPYRLFILVSMFPLSLSLNWLLRNKIDEIQKSITPLVWLFGLFVLFSLPVVVYRTILQQPEKTSASESTLTNKIKRPNIIYISFDALTARDMSLYGYERDTTPFMKEWAKSATVFTRAEAEGNNTFETTPSMMTGKRVWTHQRYHEYEVVRKIKEEESMPAILKKYGYFNIALVVNHRASVVQILL